MTDELRQDISAILATIPEECAFTSHTIIEILRNDYPEHYAAAQGKSSDAQFHGNISTVIKGLACKQGYIKQGNAWSKNVNGNPSKCKYFEPINNIQQ